MKYIIRFKINWFWHILLFFYLLLVLTTYWRELDYLSAVFGLILGLFIMEGVIEYLVNELEGKKNDRR